VRACAGCGRRLGADPGLDLDSIDAIARRVVEMLADCHDQHDPTRAALIDATQVARQCGRSRAWVYDNADLLGAIRVGSGPRPRVLFDPRLVAERLTSCSARRGSPEPPDPIPTRERQRRPAARSGDARRLLPVKGDSVHSRGAK
jgi:hypothetical protein